MKAVLIHLFALAGCAVAAPSSASTHDIDLPGTGTAVVGARGALEGRTLNPTYCYHDNPLRDLLNTKVAASASVFCSGYLQQTSIVTQTFTAYTSTSTSLTTSTTTTDTTTTATITAPTTIVTSTLECGVSGYGTGAYDFDVNESFGGTVNDCQAHCAGENAVSFGYGSNTCACYNQNVQTNVFEQSGTGYTFYDIGCNLGGNAKRVVAPAPTCVAKPQANPTYINFATSLISSACSCLISSASAPCTVTKSTTLSTGTGTTAIVPATETDTITLTSTAPGPTTTIFV
ncbi:hypothetical protein V8E51_006827 [Hyaloscypha variabilis]